MRPATLAEVADRSRRGEEIERTLAEFLDEFYSAGDSDSAYQMLVEEPPETDDVKLDALLAAVAEYLALQYSRNRAPKWVFHPKRILKGAAFHDVLECTRNEGMACSQQSGGVQESQHIYRIPPPSPKIVGPGALDVGGPPLTPTSAKYHEIGSPDRDLGIEDALRRR